tara:strand:+ start:17495 stop:17623 length:129 start_codon:yes stop_codon:yes gene_type:complete
MRTSSQPPSSSPSIDALYTKRFVRILKDAGSKVVTQPSKHLT